MFVDKIDFPEYTGVRCLMMPYVQGEPDSVPEEYHSYYGILKSQYLKKGDIGYLTIDESIAKAGKPHRGDRSKTDRAIHTEVGRIPGTELLCWGGGSWGGRINTILGAETQILLANSIDDSCAVWDVEHRDLSIDGDIGYDSHMYPYDNAVKMKAGDVVKIGVFTPHESLPVKEDTERQFIRIISSSVYGREPYFTHNPLMQ